MITNTSGMCHDGHASIDADGVRLPFVIAGRDVATTGNSGSGVFDAGANACSVLSSKSESTPTPKASQEISPNISFRHRLSASSCQLKYRL